MAAMANSSGERILAPTKACGLFQFSAVLVRTDEQLSLPQVVRNVPAEMPIVKSQGKGLVVPSLGITRWGEHRVLLEPADSILLTTILRI